MIIAFLNQKGGVGKTTLSYSFATALAQAGHKVLLVDADPQHGAITWQSHREAAPLFAIVGLPTDELHREMTAHAPQTMTTLSLTRRRRSAALPVPLSLPPPLS